METGKGVSRRPCCGVGSLPYLSRMGRGREFHNPVPGLGDRLFTSSARHEKWLTGHLRTAELYLLKQI